jgi:hypothetical protein
MQLILDRIYFEDGTNGVLSVQGNKICNTIELPDLGNIAGKSCIPEGNYEIEKRWSFRFGWHLLIKNVPGRKYILFHSANDALKELKGCIATVTRLTGPGKGVDSRLAFKKLKALVYPALDRKERVFLTINKKIEYENCKQFKCCPKDCCSDPTVL